MFKRAIWKNLALTAIGIGLLVCVWVVAWVAVGNEYVVPAFSDCVKKLAKLLFTDAGFWRAFLHTFLRVLQAFVWSVALAMLVATLGYVFPAVERVFAPVVVFLRSAPVMAVLLIILVWTNAGVAPVIVAFLSLFPTLYAGVFGAISAVDKELVEMSRVYNVPVRKRIAKLYLPTIAPFFAREAGAALGFGIKLVVSAEILVRTRASLGILMQDAQIFGEMPTLFALVIVACAFGFLCDCLGGGVARLFERRGK
ncbi:MAG: ABC transporter permease subunit [Clostridia bacterium]|nr:ABC transporter permease subunit [Clostridia bacterium]